MSKTQKFKVPQNHLFWLDIFQNLTMLGLVLVICHWTPTIQKIYEEVLPQDQALPELTQYFIMTAPYLWIVPFLLILGSIFTKKAKNYYIVIGYIYASFTLSALVMMFAFISMIGPFILFVNGGGGN